ncbi:hypothetical protein BU17DRAFT_62670 [Hysterangium stoloniferum]|nr:hypothetical protein BU17DRAFT_62670 [Hysterangium stoloniferum]
MYITPFIGDTATNFIEYLKRTDDEVRTNKEIIYTKAIPVVQSSGTGKLRMLTEAGRQIFTLPICLRQAGAPGYPPSDLEVIKYFAALSKDNNPSVTAHDAIACFLATAYTIMLDWLQITKIQYQFDRPQLLKHWHELMEPQGVLLRLLQGQGSNTNVEMAWLLPPYVAVGFDQQMIAKGQTPTISHMRLCLDLVLANSEAAELADRSVAHHMRLLTGFSANGETFYTHSPSEPIFALGSVDILYNTVGTKRLGTVLRTLSNDLYSAGLVEKGIMGELGARTLLVARDFAAPLESDFPNILEPVRLLDFFYTLFGNNEWAGSN